MGMSHYGEIEAGKAYTTTALAEILGKKDERFLGTYFTRGLPYAVIGRTRYVAGAQFIRFIERLSQCDPDEDDVAIDPEDNESGQDDHPEDSQDNDDLDGPGRRRRPRK